MSTSFLDIFKRPRSRNSQRGSHDSRASVGSPLWSPFVIGSSKSPPQATPSPPPSPRPDSRSDATGGPTSGDLSIHVSDADEKETGTRGLYSIVSPPAKVALEILKESSDAFTPLKSVAGALSIILDHCDRTMKNYETMESLMRRVKRLEKTLVKPAPEGETSEIERRKTLKRKLETILRDLEPLKEQGKVKRFLFNIKDAEVLTDMTEDIREAMMEYQTAVQQDLYNKNCELIDTAELTLLNGVHRAADAGFLAGDREGCLRGTRKDILLQIEKWAGDDIDRRVFWLNGLAGTGKSTIAQSFAEISFADGELGASFFCSRDFEDRSNVRTIFPTLAFHLAHQCQEFRKQLMLVLKTNPDVGRESLNSQLAKIIVGPLKATQIRTLIIIDALDECKDEQPASALLSVLSRYIHEIPKVKFLITGRPEPPIRDGFRLKSLLPITEVLKLHDVERSSVDEDIKLYLATRLTGIRKAQHDREFPEEWPSPYDIDVLCKKAAGLFIYASTVIKFVASTYYLPTERLDQIILHSRNAIHEGGVDVLYAQILKLAFRDVDPDDQEPYDRFRIVVGTVLLVFHPLSRKALSGLDRRCRTQSHISTTLHHLHSLLHVPEGEDAPIRFFHKSFPDFLTDRKRCKDERFFIDPSVHHENILFSCLELMKGRLKRNICDLDDYAILGKVDDLPARREKWIGSALEYACRFWTRHLAKVPSKGPHVKRVREAVDEFFATRLLYWIEALSTIEHLGGAIYAINDIRQWFISAEISNLEQVDDGERFILEHFDTICDSPSHIYHSALPLSPSSSWLRERYGTEVPREVHVVMGLPAKWDACSRTISVGGHPSALAYCGNMIAVGLESENVVLLDAITGTKVSVLLGHKDTIIALTFSLDGTLLVSGSEDNTINLWDVQTGGVIKTFNDHPSAISSVSISPDSTAIAAGTSDGTIYLWDIRTGARHSVEIHHDEVTAVSFSPNDPRHLISSSMDGTVQRWDVDGQRVGTPWTERSGAMHVAYSSDGTRFVSCGGTFAVVRDSKSGTMVVQLDAPIPELEFHFCCFSPDGTLVACAANDTIYVWDITDPEARLVGNLPGHSLHIISLAFTSSLLSGSQDKTVKIWQCSTLQTGLTTTENTPEQLDSTQVESANLFAKEGVVVTSHSSGAVKTWDLMTGTCKSSFSTPAQGTRDTYLVGDTLILVWREPEGKEYHIWDVGKGQALREVGSSLFDVVDLRISGDGSKIFGQDDMSIEARSIQTGEAAGLVLYHGGDRMGGLVVHGSKVWLTGSKDEEGWDFGNGGTSTSYGDFLGQHGLGFVDRAPRTTRPASVCDTTGRQVFRLPERYMKPDMKRRWDGRFLLVYSRSGEVVVIDFDSVLPNRGP